MRLHCFAFSIIIAALLIACFLKSRSTKAILTHKPAIPEKSLVGTSIKSEQEAIVTFLSECKVIKITQATHSLRLLLEGNIAVEAGLYLDQLIPNQTHPIKVVSVTRYDFTVGWVDAQTGFLTGETKSFKYNSGAFRYFELASLPPSLESRHCHSFLETDNSVAGVSSRLDSVE